MAWLKGAHIATLAVWCACLFYLPALLNEVRRAQGEDALRRARIMARATFVMVASPAAVLAIITGTILVVAAGAGGLWLAVKLTLVALMVVFHLQCGKLITSLDHLSQLRSSARLLSLLIYPTLLIPAVLWMVLGKPV